MELRYNPNHGQGGRFASAGGGEEPQMNRRGFLKRVAHAVLKHAVKHAVSVTVAGVDHAVAHAIHSGSASNAYKHYKTGHGSGYAARQGIKASVKTGFHAALQDHVGSQVSGHLEKAGVPQHLAGFLTDAVVSRITGRRDLSEFRFNPHHDASGHFASGSGGATASEQRPSRTKAILTHLKKNALRYAALGYTAYKVAQVGKGLHEMTKTEAGREFLRNTKEHVLNQVGIRTPGSWHDQLHKDRQARKAAFNFKKDNPEDHRYGKRSALLLAEFRFNANHGAGGKFAPSGGGSSPGIKERTKAITKTVARKVLHGVKKAGEFFDRHQGKVGAYLTVAGAASLVADKVVRHARIHRVQKGIAAEMKRAHEATTPGWKKPASWKGEIGKHVVEGKVVPQRLLPHVRNRQRLAEYRANPSHGEGGLFSSGSVASSRAERSSNAANKASMQARSKGSHMKAATLHRRAAGKHDAAMRANITDSAVEHHFDAKAFHMARAAEHEKAASDKSQRRELLPDVELRFNPNHGEGGKFASSGGGSAAAAPAEKKPGAIKRAASLSVHAAKKILKPLVATGGVAVGAYQIYKHLNKPAGSVSGSQPSDFHSAHNLDRAAFHGESESPIHTILKAHAKMQADKQRLHPKAQAALDRVHAQVAREKKESTLSHQVRKHVIRPALGRLAMASAQSGVGEGGVMGILGLRSREFRFNPHHEATSGRFTSAGAAGSVQVARKLPPAPPKGPHPVKVAIHRALKVAAAHAGLIAATTAAAAVIHASRGGTDKAGKSTSSTAMKAYRHFKSKGKISATSKASFKKHLESGFHQALTLHVLGLAGLHLAKARARLQHVAAAPAESHASTLSKAAHASSDLANRVNSRPAHMAAATAHGHALAASQPGSSEEAHHKGLREHHLDMAALVETQKDRARRLKSGEPAPKETTTKEAPPVHEQHAEKTVKTPKAETTAQPKVKLAKKFAKPKPDLGGGVGGGRIGEGRPGSNIIKKERPSSQAFGGVGGGSRSASRKLVEMRFKKS